MRDSIELVEEWFQDNDFLSKKDYTKLMDDFDEEVRKMEDGE